MKRSKKGFSLIMAMMIGTVLLIMALGFLTLVDNSSRTVKRNAQQAKLYWLAESASNYNVRWWVNLPDSIRKDWPSVYVTKGEYSDTAGEELDDYIFPNGKGITDDGKIYRHSSSKLEGNYETENPDLSLEDGRYKLYNVRYKGSRKDFPEQAVWILDSYAYDTATGDLANVCLSNVYNYIGEEEREPFYQAELINQTLANSGFHGVKGRFNEQDTRYGPCFFGGLVNLDYQTGSIKNGPQFYGPVRSSSDCQSWFKNETNLVNSASDYGYGIGMDGAQSEADFLDLAKMTLLGGYEKNVEPMNTDAVVWTWDAVVEYGAESKIYFPDLETFPAGTDITIRLNVVNIGGTDVTQASLWSGNISGKPDRVLTIGDGSNSYVGVAVPDIYDEAYIQGVSNTDFSIITETSPINVTGNLYLAEMEPSLDYLEENHDQFTLDNPYKPLLDQLWADMLIYDPAGHLAVIAGLGIVEDGFVKQEAPIYFPSEQLIYSNAAYICNYGELTAKGTGNTNLKLFNVGPSMVLGQQEKMSGPADTAQKWPKVFIQDQRYLREDEPLPPGCGLSPDAHPLENQEGLNKNHRWALTKYGQTKDPVSTILKENNSNNY